MTYSGKRRRVAGLAVALAAVGAGTASAQLGLPLPALGGVVQTTQQTTGSLPVVGGALTGATGAVGGIVATVDGVTAGAIDHAIGGVLNGGAPGTSGAAPGGAGDGLQGLPADAVSSLLLVFGGAADAADGAPVVIDGVAPTPRVTVLSRLRQIAKTGSLRLQVSSDEAGVVALGGAVRPGLARKGFAHGHSRALVKWPAGVLAFRGPGALQVTIKLSRAARITLGRARDARIGVATVAADLQHNQRWGYVKRHMPR